MKRQHNVRWAAVVVLAVVAVLGSSTPAAALGGIDDPAFVAEVARVEQANQANHIWWGHLAEVTYDQPALSGPDRSHVIGIDGLGDGTIWTGNHLWAQTYRFLVRQQEGAGPAELGAIRAGIDEIATGFHRRINIAKSWKATPCPPTDPQGADTPSCSVVDGEAGILFRNCVPSSLRGDPRFDALTRPGGRTTFYGPFPFDEDDDGASDGDWYCDGGVSRDMYAGAITGLLAFIEHFPASDPIVIRAARDLMTIEDYFSRHGYSIVYPHTKQGDGIDNFVFPLFVINPEPRINMALAAHRAAEIAGSPADRLRFGAIWDEEYTALVGQLDVEFLLAIESPAQGYYNFNLNHLTNVATILSVDDPVRRDRLRRAFSIIDTSTRDDVNAEFEALTYLITGERERFDLAVRHTAEQASARRRESVEPATNLVDRCGVDYVCVPEDEVHTYVRNPDGTESERVTEGSSSTVRSLYPLPVDQREHHQDFAWQKPPYAVRSADEAGGYYTAPIDPRHEFTGADVLFPYWALRYGRDVLHLDARAPTPLDTYPVRTEQGPRGDETPPVVPELPGAAWTMTALVGAALVGWRRRRPAR
jgi:hypothetical protein